MDKTERYDVGGMSCAACSARVEKAVGSVEGVTSCSVSLLTNSMTVEGSASSENIISAVEKAGYTAKPQTSDNTDHKPKIKIEKPNEVRPLVQRFCVSLALLLILMYFSMGHTMWGFPLPPFFSGNPISIALVQLLLSAVIMVINKRFFVSGFKGIIHRAPNMDTLVSLGSAASFVWSLYELFMMTVSGAEEQMRLLHGLYFESAAMILVLITLGKILEAHSKGKTTDALRALMDLSPKTAVTERDGRELEIPIEEVKIGDIFILRPGMSVPVDGVVIEGESAVDESMLTGESVPVDKSEGSEVYSATINQSGFIRCRASRVGEDTTLSQIIRTVYEASSTKAPIARIADKVSGIFVPAVIGIAILTLAIWLFTGAQFAYALERGISVLVISCPCALGLATPVSIMVGNGVGAKAGILFRNAEALETAGKTQIIALDKTGTITKGEPSVTDIIPSENISKDELIQTAYSIERLSSHPLARAITSYAESKDISAPECEDFRNLAGHGLEGKLGTETVLAGSLSFIRSKIDLKDKEIGAIADELADSGKTPMLFAKGGRLLGIIAAADTVKDDSRTAVEEFAELGLRTVMITGDNERTAKAVAKSAGIERVYAGVLPSGKSEIITKLKRYGKTAMTGDGINDAPALTAADTGIAIGSGTDIAIDSAGIVLVGSSLREAAAAIRLSRKTLRNIHENLFWAFIYNVIGIPLAAGLWIPVFGLTLNPMFGAAAMSLSSFCVVTNALRLNLFDPHKRRKSKKAAVELPAAEINNKGEQKMIKTTVKVEGMMCPMCEKHASEAVQKNFEIESVKASHTDGTVEIISAEPLDAQALMAAINESGYKATAVETE